MVQGKMAPQAEFGGREGGGTHKDRGHIMKPVATAIQNSDHAHKPRF